MEKIELNKVVVMAIHMKNIMSRWLLGIVATAVDTASWLVTLLSWPWRIARMYLVARHSAVGRIVLTVEMWQRIVRPIRTGVITFYDKARKGRDDVSCSCQSVF